MPLPRWLFDPALGLWSAELDIPAGDYQFKVTNGSWDENWGAWGAPGGDNITFTAVEGKRAHTSSLIPSRAMPLLVLRNRSIRFPAAGVKQGSLDVQSGHPLSWEP